MYRYLFTLCTVVLAAVVVVAKPSAWIIHSDPVDYESEWKKFKKVFRKQYKDSKEEHDRFIIFRTSLDRVVERNSKNIRAGGDRIFGVTKFSDMTQEEFDSKNKGRKNFGFGQKYKQAKVAQPVKKQSSNTEVVDWTATGVVTPVKNQGQCGSCWAHSATETIESAWMMAGEAPWPLSVQQATSCTAQMLGCGGGDTIAVYEQLLSDATKFGQATSGLVADAMAPYTQSMYEECLGRSCTVTCDNREIGNLTAAATYESLTGYYVQIKGYTYTTTPCYDTCENQDFDLLNSNVAEYGPASVCVNAGTWNDYVGGVMMTDTCGAYGYADLDHCVQLTGFNLTADQPYYLVRNSWATTWGEDGYIKLSAEGNTCGFADEATQVTIAPQ